MLSGNAAVFDLCTVKELARTPLKGMNLAFLGSSVTQGHSADGTSFVEFICRHNGCSYTKEAVSGTTLTDDGRDSYVQRLIHNLDPSTKYNLFICQLSTNDAAKGYPLGVIVSSRTLNDFDTSTVTGALEFIICYVIDTWRCPVVFYTNPKYESSRYEEMVNILYRLKAKWGIEIIDLWKLLDTSDVNLVLYMADAIHPTKAGYLKWWMPTMEQALYDIASRLCGRYPRMED